MVFSIVANPSLGDALAYTLPIAISLGRSNLITTNENVDKILRNTPYFLSGSNSKSKIIFTGGPGWYKKLHCCRFCPNDGICNWCGKYQNHHKLCIDFIRDRKCFGEWYGFRKINIKFTKEVYRPKKICATWGLEWQDNMDKLNLEWYQDYYQDFRCSQESILVNIKSSSLNRALKPELIDYLKKNWDVREFDFSKDIRSNLFLINQVKHIVTVDTSTVWLAKYLDHKNIHVICPDGLSERLGCRQLVSDQSKRYIDINYDLVIKKLDSLLI
jgi:hypothetical protein